VNKDSTPITIFFMEMIQVLVAETNKYYYNEYLGMLENNSGWS